MIIEVPMNLHLGVILEDLGFLIAGKIDIMSENNMVPDYGCFFVDYIVWKLRQYHGQPLGLPRDF
jgi:hypothetical protein